MTKTVHIITVGTNKDLIVESIKTSGKPIQKAYLVIEKDNVDSHKNAEEIKKMLGSFIDVRELHVDCEIYSALLEILKVIKKEKRDGNEVLINLSDASENLCLACYISAQISESKVYMALSNEKIRIVDLLIPPIKKIGDDKITIIKTIDENGGEIESINKLIEILEGKTQDQKKYMAQRARMSYHLKGLEEDGLIEMKREGKNVRIRLTPLGKSYVLAYEG